MPNGTMKALLAVLFINILYINLECANNKLHDPKIIVNTYPKKVQALKKNIQIKNSRKYEKLGALDDQKATKKPAVDKKPYTVFPPFAEKKFHDKPVSIHFQGDINKKSRVKKVLLPEYGFSSLRNKRSADSQANRTGNVAVANKKIKRKRFIRKGIKRKGKSVRNSTLKINKSKRKSKIIKDAIRTEKIKNKSVRNSTLKRNKSKRKSKIIKDAIRTEKIKNTNLYKRQNVRIGKKRKIGKHINTHGNQTKLDLKLPKLDSNIGSKGLKKVGKPKQERKLTREQDQRVRRNRRLIAGRDAMIQDYPYVVSIQKDQQHWCAGALLNPRLVITTANCVWKAKRVSRMRVRAGSRHMERGGQLVKIQEVVKHPKWSIRTLPDNDVALLLLSENIKFSDSVHAVDLPNRAMWPAFEDVWVTSWGAERRDGIFTSTGVTLQVYHAMLVDHEKCNNVTKRFGIAVSQNFICVAQTGRRAPCTRDTGAPAVSDGILWGLASWGIRKLCGTERFPAMFSYLASRSNLDFITNATHYLMSDKRFYPYADRFVFDRAADTSTDTTTNF